MFWMVYSKKKTSETRGAGDMILGSGLLLLPRLIVKRNVQDEGDLQVQGKELATASFRITKPEFHWVMGRTQSSLVREDASW